MLVQKRQTAHYVQCNVLAVIPPPQAGQLAVGGVQRFEQVATLGSNKQERGRGSDGLVACMHRKQAQIYALK